MIQPMVSLSLKILPDQQTISLLKLILVESWFMQMQMPHQQLELFESGLKAPKMTYYLMLNNMSINQLK